MPDRPALVVATRNRGKLGEFRRLLRDHPWRLLSLDDAGFEGDVDEPGPGYAENARIKAVEVCRATGLCALGDDSGIEVEALRGWPGPHSSRWLGEDADDASRLRGLLDEVERRCPDDRRVRYVAVLALARPGAEEVVARGVCEGVLVEPRGEAGFGYDPSFLSTDLGRTFGEVSAEEKDRVSHRARAVARLAEAGVLEITPRHL
ncbi:MAG TPA: non-canonical purine NTP pyrophosphatase [Candidatus Dormibacteraeota bacterium]|jgi:XTP/dITP diphosphohydrolase|nr:non-canonical purine NTP pyrophosphatase [Candidatus Dormibacteraeota bacterium]